MNFGKKGSTMTSSIWRPSEVGTSGGKEISIHNFEELAALHAVAKILAQPGEGITGKVAQTGRPMAFANLGKEVHVLDRA
jgi:hypothetical protein